jgi:DNA-binding transcriptional LysR family regulator
MVRLEGLRLFAVIVEAGSLSGAGRRLGLAKSGVSERLRELEDSVGAQLLHRSSRSLRLTEEGARFHQDVVRILADLDESLGNLSAQSDDLWGTVRITAPTSFGVRYVCPAINAFMLRHPQLIVELVLDDRALDISTDGYDMALRVGQLSDSSMIAKRIATSRRVVIAGSHTECGRNPPTQVAELEHFPSMSYGNIRTNAEWRFLTPDGNPVIVRPPSRLRVTSGDAQLLAVEAGLGIAVLPRFIAAEAIHAGRVVEVLLDMEPTSDPVHLIFPPDRRHSKRVRAVIDYLAEVFAGVPPWELGTTFGADAGAGDAAGA